MNTEPTGTQPPSKPHHGLTGDVKCLRCEAWNLPDNKICGRCGANLPLVYDEEGHVVRLQENSQRTTGRVLPALPRGAMPNVNRARWMMRLLILLAAFLAALWIMAHRR